MPYYLTSDQSSGLTPYGSKSAALADRQPNQTVTFRATPAERDAWIGRERDRVRLGEYARVPWADDLPEMAGHFVHLARKSPGHIAYTPDDEYGVTDRQQSMRPGRYLQTYYPDLSAGQIEAYTAACRAAAGSAGLQIARSADEISRVYQNGPSSCMSHPIGDDDYACGEYHPTEAYGDSDLGVAYLGTPDRVTARAIVWPDRLIYGRCYGDTVPLEAALRAAGYARVGNEHNSMDYRHENAFVGARIRRISVGDDYLMPYLDCGSGVRMSADRGYWEITTSSRRDDDIDVQRTDGRSGETREVCAHCESRNRTAGSNYCGRCEDAQYYCERCDTDYFDYDSRYIDDQTVCASCASEAYTCGRCDHAAFDVDTQFTEVGAVLYCDACRDRLFSYCEHCEEYYAMRHGACPDCPADDDDDDDDDDTDTADGIDIPPVDAADQSATIHVGSVITIPLMDGSTVAITAAWVSPCSTFYAHRTPHDESVWTLTHARSSLRITVGANLPALVDLARRLTADPAVSWAFDTIAAAPDTTLAAGRAILASWRRAEPFDPVTRSYGGDVEPTEVYA